MFLRSPDPAAHAVIAGDRLYPVRDGIFLVPDKTAADPLFESYQQAVDIPAGVAAELAELGSHEHQTAAPDAAAQAAAAAAQAGHSDLPGASHTDALLAQAADELRSVMAEKDALADRLRELVDEAAKPFEVIAGDFAHLLDITVDHEARTVTVAPAHPDVVIGEQAGPAETDGKDDRPGEPAVEQLLELSRGDLNDHAAKVGVVDPEKLPNKQAVADAIVAKTAEQNA